MANRSYLYSLGNRPASYADRPDTITGLSEWAYAVPFCYRVLMSGDPRECASLISDGFEDEPADKKTRLYAISADFDIGFARLRKFLAVVRLLADGQSPDLIAAIDETIAFLEARRDRYLLLETIELDMMTETDQRAAVGREIAACRHVASAIDALPADVTQAGTFLKAAAAQRREAPFDVFHELKLDDDFDYVVGDRTKYPLGLANWNDILFYQLWNRAQFQANR